MTYQISAILNPCYKPFPMGFFVGYAAGNKFSTDMVHVVVPLWQMSLLLHFAGKMVLLLDR